MSKKEGEILKNYVKSKGIGISKFAVDMGYADRQGLNYQLNKETLDFEVKERAASILGVSVDDIFGQTTKKNISIDIEKETLKDLVETQKSLIKYQNEFITAQLIRNEAFVSVILARMAEIEIATVSSRKGTKLDAVLDEAESDVQEKIQEIKHRLKLSS